MKRLILYRIPLLAAVTTAVLLPGPALAQSPVATPVQPQSLKLESPDTMETEWMHWTSGRYRITPGDVLDFKFPFVRELDQTVSVQPDGFITLKDLPDIKVQGRTVEQVKADVRAAYEPFVRDPIFTISLAQFERPYFVANGEVETPGRYELRGATTVSQALAFAGGTTGGADLSHVLLFRRLGDGTVDVKEINVKRMFTRKDLSEDPLLRPGDMIVVPKSVIGKLAPVLSVFRWRF